MPKRSTANTTASSVPPLKKQTINDSASSVQLNLDATEGRLELEQDNATQNQIEAANLMAVANAISNANANAEATSLDDEAENRSDSSSLEEVE